MGDNRYPRRGKQESVFLSLDCSDTTNILPTSGTNANKIILNRDMAQAEVVSLLTGAGAGFTVQYPWGPLDAGMQVIVKNASGQTATFKAMTTDGGTTPTTGQTVANAAKAILVYDGTDFVTYVLSA